MRVWRAGARPTALSPLGLVAFSPDGKALATAGKLHVPAAE